MNFTDMIDTITRSWNELGGPAVTGLRVRDRRSRSPG
jgi:hypothetical protein